jgi:hypothetical protein
MHIPRGVSIAFRRPGGNVLQAPSRKSRSSNRHSHRRLVPRLFTALVILFLASATFLFLRPRSTSLSAPGARPAATAATRPPLGVRIPASEPETPAALAHLYSVIPQGIHSEKQFARFLANHPVVARHYANFDLHKFRLVRLRHDRKAYVSFRLGNLIFWTSRKIWLFAGETLVTDGTHYARARCGNRISYVPKEPTTALEPSEPALEAPILHLTPASFHFSPLLGSSSVQLPPPNAPDGGGSPFFPVIFLPPGGGTPVGTPVGSPLPGAPQSTPEPATLLLLSAGLAMLGAKYFWKLRRG